MKTWRGLNKGWRVVNKGNNKEKRERKDEIECTKLNQRKEWESVVGKVFFFMNIFHFDFEFGECFWNSL